MSEADLYMGLGSLVYALAKADGRLHPQEINKIRDMLQQERHGDVALCSFTARDYHRDSVEEAYQFALRRFRAYPDGLTAERLLRFSQILEAVARMDGKLSEAERDVLEQFLQDMLPDDLALSVS